MMTLRTSRIPTLPAGLCLLLALLPAARAAAEEEPAPFEWRYTLKLNLAPDILSGAPSVYDRMDFAIDYRHDFLLVAADLSMINDGKYTPASHYVLGRYFILNKGGLVFDFDTLTARAGRFTHTDFIDSPYSLFISSDPLPAVLADVTFHGGLLTYESRWIRLNERSRIGYPDRGANYKLYAFHVGDFRFGVQDSTVYVDRSFDAEYFLSPMPHIFTQIITKSLGKPWAEEGNDNALMGLFLDRTRSDSYLYAQWLLDDINLEFLVPEFLKPILNPTKIPQKTAWSLGGTYRLPFGRLGFYHAGATKYIFAATAASSSYSDYPYEYAYYPAVEYKLTDGTDMTLGYRDNYIGYRYGENNIAFLLDYTHRIGAMDLYASLEYVVSGSKSPANPWHEYHYVTDTDRETKLLDDPVLEHTVTSRATASWRWRNMSLFTDLTLGAVFNRLGLEEAVVDEPKIFRPQPGDHRLIYRWTVGFTHLLPIGRNYRPPRDDGSTER